MNDVELDLAVAKAAGIEVLKTVSLRGMCWYRTDHFEQEYWRPSTDMKDAWEAAEKVELLDEHYLTQTESLSFVICRKDDHTEIAEELDGPRVICEAILATEGGEQS